MPERAAALPSTSMLGRTIKQVVLLLIAALIPAWATAFFQIKWQLPPEVPTLSVSSAQQNKTNALWVDVRNPERFAQAHIGDAILFDENTHDASLAKLLQHWKPDMQIVVYGEGMGSDRADRVARRLKKDLNTKKVFLLEGGWASWPQK